MTITPDEKTTSGGVFDFLDKETLGLLNGGNDIEFAKLAEVHRHNTALENANVFKTKKEEHEYEMMIFQDFQKLKKDYDTDRIIKIFPDMEAFV